MGDTPKRRRCLYRRRRLVTAIGPRTNRVLRHFEGGGYDDRKKSNVSKVIVDLLADILAEDRRHTREMVERLEKRLQGIIDDHVAAVRDEFEKQFEVLRKSEAEHIRPALRGNPLRRLSSCW